MESTVFNGNDRSEKWHRLLQMASTASNGNDRSEKWHRPFQMATTLCEREICGGEEKGNSEPTLSSKSTISQTKNCVLVIALEERPFYLLQILLPVI